MQNVLINMTGNDPVIYLFHKYLLSTFYGPQITSGAGERASYRQVWDGLCDT